MPRWRKPDPPKRCARCNKRMNRKYYGATLEDYNTFVRRKYCSLTCANSTGVTKAQGAYRQARKQRKKYCESCGYKEQLQVHHLDGDIYNNAKKNLQTLCIYCHVFWHNTHSRLGMNIGERMLWLFPRLLLASQAE